MKVMNGHKYRTLVIFDWDDTLFPTTWTVKNNINLSDDTTHHKYIVYFSKLDMLLYKLLSECLRSGSVFIVTNAVKRWVSVSSSILPNTQKIINNNIQIISARDEYQEKYPNNIELWKRMTFQDLVSKYFNKYPFQHIISVGDAEHEFNALTDLYNESSITRHRLLKTVRFIREPSFDALIDQLEVLDNCINKVLNNKEHMDLTFKSKK